MGYLVPKAPPLIHNNKVMLRSVNRVTEAMGASGIAAVKLLDSLPDIRTYGPEDWQAGRVPNWRDDLALTGHVSPFGMFIPDGWQERIAAKPLWFNPLSFDDWVITFELGILRLKELFEDFTDGCRAILGIGEAGSVPNIPHVPPPPPPLMRLR